MLAGRMRPASISATRAYASFASYPRPLSEPAFRRGVRTLRVASHVAPRINSTAHVAHMVQIAATTHHFSIAFLP
jgi:hypothetical protein